MHPKIRTFTLWHLLASISAVSVLCFGLIGVPNTGCNLSIPPPSPPPPTEGACCVGTTCSLTTQANCTGTYHGDGTSCNFSACVTPPQPGAPFGGDAALVRANIQGTETSVVDTGALPATGGVLEKSLLDVSIQGFLAADVIHASVIGQGLRTDAEASIADLEMTVLGHTIKFDFVASFAKAECVNGAPTTNGRFDIASLLVDGQSITVTTAVNQRFSIVDISNNVVGRITANEQISNNNGSTGEFVVNALHFEIFNSADVLVGHARAAINCQGQARPVNDFMTGGGFIETNNEFANFGFVAGNTNGTLSGHLVYIDHGTDLKVKATSVTAYTAVNSTARHFEGACEVNQVGGFTYQVDATDNGEPGNNDTFKITLSSGYTANGTLIGGNIQLHD